MLRGFFFFLSLLLAALGLLTVVKAPDWLNWKFALLAGEFGYVLAFGAILLGLGAVLAATEHRGLRIATAAVALAAAGLLVQPCFQARRIGRSLPERLTGQFGPVTLASAPFAWGTLFHPGPERVPAVTFAYAGALQLDYYRAVGRSPAPVVVIVHGGGWNDGDRGQIPELNYWLARHGYGVADISYRLAPGAVWPAQREDVLAAVAYLKAHADSLGLDPTRLVLLGRSAGGQIAEATAYAAKDPAIRGLVGLYAPADMNFAYQFGREDDALKSPQLLRQFLGGTPAQAQANYDSASGIGLVTRSGPPTLLVHGEIDTLVWYRQSERLAKRLADAGVPHVLVTLPWATHAVEYHLTGPSGQLSAYALEWFLAAVTK